jgi:hypothetical protein
MFHFRVGALFLLGLLAITAFYGLFEEQGSSFESNLGAFILFSLFILALGPFWPGSENIDKWGRKSRLNLPTDNTLVAIYVASFLGGLYCFYKAWDTYANPAGELFRLERTAFRIAGMGGVVTLWLSLALGCLVYGIVTYGKARKA